MALKYSYSLVKANLLFYSIIPFRVYIISVPFSLLLHAKCTAQLTWLLLYILT